MLAVSGVVALLMRARDVLGSRLIGERLAARRYLVLGDDVHPAGRGDGGCGCGGEDGLAAAAGPPAAHCTAGGGSPTSAAAPATGGDGRAARQGYYGGGALAADRTASRRADHDAAARRRRLELESRGARCRFARGRATLCSEFVTGGSISIQSAAGDQLRLRIGRVDQISMTRKHCNSLNSESLFLPVFFDTLRTCSDVGKQTRERFSKLDARATLTTHSWPTRTEAQAWRTRAPVSAGAARGSRYGRAGQTEASRAPRPLDSTSRSLSLSPSLSLPLARTERRATSPESARGTFLRGAIAARRASLRLL